MNAQNQKYTVKQRLLVSVSGVYVTSFFMLANAHLHVTSQCHDITSTLIAIQCDSLCTNCRFLKTGLVDHIGVCTDTNNISLSN